MDKQFVCINCPMGCRLSVKLTDGVVESVSGNICKRGEYYAHQEAVEPMRILTSLMRVESTDHPCSVKTSAPIPKRLIKDCVQAIFSQQVKLPVHVGDVIIRDVCGTGSDIIATQEILQ